MPKKLFLDIETIPPAEADRAWIEEFLERRKAAGTALRGDIEEETGSEEAFRRLALKSEFGRVLTIGILLEKDGEVLSQGLFGRDPQTKKFHMDEGRTLRSFWRMMQELQLGRDLIIGHNILDFDLPFLLKRSVVNRFRPSVSIPFQRYRQQPVFDTMWEWGCWRHRTSLEEVAVALGIDNPKSDGMDGGKIYDALCQGKDEEIALYCMRDVECVREVYYRLRFEDLPHSVSYAAKSSDGASTPACVPPRINGPLPVSLANAWPAAP